MLGVIEAYVNRDGRLVITKKDGDNIQPGEEIYGNVKDFIERVIDRDVDEFETFQITIRKI